MDTAQDTTPAKHGTRHGPKRDPVSGRISGGNPGNKGGGRKPIAFLQECERLTDTVILPKLARYVSSHGPDDEGYRWAATKLLEYAKGKPAAVQVTVNQTNNYLLETPAKTPTPDEWRARFAGRN